MSEAERDFNLMISILYKSENWLNYASRSTSNDNKVIEKMVPGMGFHSICSTMVELHCKLVMDKNW